MSDPDASALDPMVGRVIQGRWRLETKLGQGGMGAVYRAEQLSIRGRRVAVKLLLPILATDPGYSARFRREAERAATVTDSRIVTVFDFGEAEDGHLFIAMEYVDGNTLSELIARGPLPFERAIGFGIQLADALQHCHEAGVIHRDVKPANVMVLAGRDDLKLMDFGIARAASDSELTKAGMVVGTLGYMAPEQITKGICSAQSDIYAWGLVMYTMLAGRTPFDGSSETIKFKHVHEPPPPIVSFRPDTPPAIEAVVLTALAKQPHERYRSMAEAAAALRRAQRAPAQVVAEEPPPVAAEIETAPPAAELEVTLPAPAAPRRHALRRIAALAALGIGGGLALLSPVIRSRVMPGADRPRPNEASAGEDATIVADALALAEFFLKGKEYERAIEELEGALRKIPGDQRLLAALDKARKAKAAVVGDGG